MDEEIKPHRLAVFAASEGRPILAEDYGDNGFSGIEMDSSDESEVQRLLKVNQRHLLGTWDTYAKERGGPYLLVDIWRLASAIRRCHGRLDLRPLGNVTGAYELMHSRYQADLMAEAEHMLPGKVRFIEKIKGERSGDFAIFGEKQREFEVKTVLATGTVELRRTGWTTAQDTARKLAIELRRKAKQGFQQIEASGTVVCVIWCDILGAAVSRELTEQEVPLREIFSGLRYVVGARCEKGEDRWFGFQTDEQWVAGLRQLETKLGERRQSSINIGFPQVKCVSTRSDWATIGRPISIDGSRQHED